MSPIFYKHHRFPSAVIRYAIWWYLSFTLSYRDFEELLAEGGIQVSYETVRRWVLKLEPVIARSLRCLRPKPKPRWHLDKIVVRVGGRHSHLWWAVADEGEVLEVLVQRRRHKAAERCVR